MSDNRVKGSAKNGDKVRYFDMANQNGPVREVFSSPGDGTHEIIWKDNEYMLYSDEEGFTWSDLRQNGWTFVTKTNA